MRFPQSEIRGHIARAAALLALAACGGGSGDSSPPPQVPLQPTLASIQANIFTPTCAVTGCHSGGAAMLGLRLDAGFSYASLVNTASAYGGGRVRVVPGNPDMSFLIEKLEPNPSVGDRMPLTGNFLQQVTIDVIREWIQNGAQP